MTVRECYARMGADYDGALRRLGNEGFIKTLLAMTYRDQSFVLLKKSLERGDAAAAFRAAHTLKGIALNLGLTPLAGAASELTETLRGGCGDVSDLFQRTARAYTEFRSAAEALLPEDLGMERVE